MFWGQEGRIGPQGLGCLFPVVGLGIQEKTLGKALQGAQGGSRQSPCPSLCRCARNPHPSVVLLDKDQLYLLGIIQDCQAARLRGLRTLKYSKEETAKAILDILGHLEYFRDRPLSLALAFEALLQLSFMRPHFSPSVVSAILHRTTEAVLGSAEEDKEGLKRPFQSLLGGLLLEAPNTSTLLQLLTDLRYYALLGSEDQRKLGASSISLLLALSRRFPNLRNTVIRPEQACFRNNLKEDDIIIEEL
ncbi:Hypothetical predicted protein [Podarcis lilfordi]|uniref:Uncharacterized protein n=1 Tax=Podarcis lilfordi TaxID=74358 RepID=A0AA35K525_9SAUR|nr:Hypothetical predicted protein [Podarcis lilfordi]